MDFARSVSVFLLGFGALDPDLRDSSARRSSMRMLRIVESIFAERQLIARNAKPL